MAAMEIEQEAKGNSVMEQSKKQGVLINRLRSLRQSYQKPTLPVAKEKPSFVQQLLAKYGVSSRAAKTPTQQREKEYER